jgi:hypothetical protein
MGCAVSDFGMRGGMGEGMGAAHITHFGPADNGSGDGRWRRPGTASGTVTVQGPLPAL